MYNTISCKYIRNYKKKKKYIYIKKYVKKIIILFLL